MSDHEDAWRAALADYVKARMTAQGLSFAKLAKRLNELTGQQSEERTALFAKIRRGAFPASFLIMLMEVLDMNPGFREELAAHLPEKGAAHRRTE